MPVDDLPLLDSEQTARIIQSTTNVKTLQKLTNNTSLLMEEANLSYRRALNQLIFNNNTVTELYPSINVDIKKDEKVDEFGLITIEKYDYERVNESFSFNSLYTSNEVIKGLNNVMVECLKIEEMVLFKVLNKIKVDKSQQTFKTRRNRSIANENKK